MFQEQQADVPIAAIRDKVDYLFKLGKDKKSLDDQVSDIKTKIAQIEAELKVLMEDNGIKMAPGTNSSCSLEDKEVFFPPGSPEEWVAFGRYIKEKHGEAVYEGMFKVHAGSAKAWIEREYAVLEQEKFKELLSLNLDPQKTIDELKAEAATQVSIPGVKSPEKITLIKQKENKKPKEKY